MKPTRALYLSVTVSLLALAACESSEPASSGSDDDSPPDAVTASDAGADAQRDGGGASDARNDAAASASRSDAAAMNNDANAGPDVPAGDPKVQVGEFSFRLVPEDSESNTPAFTHMFGKVSDAPTPSMKIWDKKDEAAGCTLTTPRVPFCEKQCVRSVCVADDVCQPNPTGQSVGTVTVRGVRTTTGKTEFQVDPVANNYQVVDVELPFPAFEEGGPIEIAAAGAGSVAPFRIQASGIAPLVLAGSEQGFPLKKGMGLPLTWTPPGKPGTSRIQVKLDISHHGGSRGMIECDVEDNGSLTIPATLTDQLLDLGVAGFPTVVVTRSSMGSTVTRFGRVDLRAYMYVESEIKIEGLISCDGDDAQCPSGQRCNSDNKTCVK